MSKINEMKKFLKEKLTINNIIWNAIIFLLGAGITFFINSSLTELTKKADIFVSMNPLDKDEIGFYYPISIINSGQKELSNVVVRVRTCYMDPGQYKENIFGTMIVGQREDTKFRETKTIETVTKKSCFPEYNLSKIVGCTIDVYKLDDKNLYIPPMNCSFFICDFCDITVIASADQLGYKRFNGTFFAPIEIKGQIVPPEILNVSIGELELFSPITLTLIGGKEICIWEETCSVRRLPTDVSIPKGPYEILLKPKEGFLSYNFTIILDY